MDWAWLLLLVVVVIAIVYFADDVCSLLAELLELLIPALERWQVRQQLLSRRSKFSPWIARTHHQPLRCKVEEFVYLSSLIYSSTQSTQDINRRSAITRTAMQCLKNQIWRSQLLTSTKLRLYNTCILPNFLYVSECWAVSEMDIQSIGLKHSTSGAFKCCWVSNGSTLSEAGELKKTTRMPPNHD